MTFHFGHANRQELDVLDTWQQAQRHYDPQGNVRIYDIFEHAMHNPSFRREVIKQMRAQFAEGGHVKSNIISRDDLEFYRQQGRNGDDCLMVMGPITRSFLDTFAPSRGHVNPVTGFPEFFSLGGIFDSIGNGLRSAFSNTIGKIPGIGGVANQAFDTVTHGIQNALPGLAGAAATGLGARFGMPQLGAMAGNMVSHMMAPGQGQPQQPGAMPQMPQQNPYQMQPEGGMPQSGMAQQPGFNPHQFMQNAYQGYQQGHGFMPAMQNAFQSAGGANGMMNSAMDAYNRYRSGMGQ